MKGVRRYLGFCLLLFVGAEAQAGPPAQRLGGAAPPPPATTTETVEAGHTNGGGGDGGAVMFPTGGAEIPGVGDPALWRRLRDNGGFIIIHQGDALRPKAGRSRGR